MENLADPEEHPCYRAFAFCKHCGEAISAYPSNIIYQFREMKGGIFVEMSDDKEITYDYSNGITLVEFMYSEHKRCVARETDRSYRHESYVPFTATSINLLGMNYEFLDSGEIPIIYFICNKFNMISSPEDFPLLDV